MNKNDKFFEEIDRFTKSKVSKEKYVFRVLIWKAIDKKDENFSIVETAIALGLYERKK